MLDRDFKVLSQFEPRLLLLEHPLELELSHSGPFIVVETPATSQTSLFLIDYADPSYVSPSAPRNSRDAPEPQSDTSKQVENRVGPQKRGPEVEL